MPKRKLPAHRWSYDYNSACIEQEDTKSGYRALVADFSRSITFTTIQNRANMKFVQKCIEFYLEHYDNS